MKSPLLLWTAIIVAASAYGQKAPIKFGNIPPEDLQMKVYEADSSAAAVILADFGESTISYNQTNGFKLLFERIWRAKILTTDGYDLADFEIALYNSGGDSEKCSSIKAVTYNFEDGKVVESKVSKENIFREKHDENIDLVKVTFPNVKVGSVIEISYDVYSDFLFNFQDWSFQSIYPTRWSEYRANIPEYFTYDKYMQGYVMLTASDQTQSARSITFTSVDRGEGRQPGSAIETSQVRYTENNFRWIAQNVPAFKNEPFMTTYRDYISRMNFELAVVQFPNQAPQQMLGNWNEINQTFYERYSSEINANGFLKSTVASLTDALVSPEEKISAILGYIKSNIIWDGTNSKYLANSLKKVVDNKKGNSAEINLLFASMLEKAGIEVSPVLTSTRDYGMIRVASPASTQFNYILCLVRVGDKKFLMDATEKLLPHNLIPRRCLNGQGFVLGKEGYSWLEIQSPAKEKATVSGEFTLSADNALVGKLKIDNFGYAAYERRKSFYSKGEQDYIKDFIGSHSWDCKNTTFTNADNLSGNFVENHELTVNENITAAGDLIYLEPFVVRKLKSNPFTLEKREYPVNFGTPMEDTYFFKFTVPENYAVEEMPQNKMLALPDNAGRFIFNTSMNGNVITVTSIVSINKPLFIQTEYPYLREFYNQIVAKQAEQIVLKKK